MKKTAIFAIFLFPAGAFAQTIVLPPTEIVSSAIAHAEVQADGRISVREVFTDNNGNQYAMDFIADNGETATMRLTSDAQVEATALGLVNEVGIR
jgi:hypothetical protein